MASPTLQCALKDVLGEAVVACDMPEPCKFPCLETCLIFRVVLKGEVHLFPPCRHVLQHPYSCAFLPRVLRQQAGDGLLHTVDRVTAAVLAKMPIAQSLGWCLTCWAQGWGGGGYADCHYRWWKQEIQVQLTGGWQKGKTVRQWWCVSSVNDPTFLPCPKYGFEAFAFPQKDLRNEDSKF